MRNLKKVFISKKSVLKFYNIKTVLFCLSVLILTSATGQSIVQEHGRLRVLGNKVVNKNNQTISLAGNSLFWSNFSEGAKFYNAQTVNHLTTNWKTDIVRASMGVEDFGGYISNPTREKNKVKAVVDAAINAGVYVIIDWHSHNAEQYQSQAISFFTEMAELYGDNDHVIYEVYNEPISQSWPVIKSYAEAVIAAIRAKDPNNLIVVGTRFYSQEVEEASNNPINKPNIAYTLHFYAGTHRQALRDKATRAINNGIALFVTEWGAVNADGNGGANTSETNRWMDFLRDNNISHANWSVSDKAEGASVVGANSGVSGLVNNNLTATGNFVKNIIENWNDNTTGGSSQTPFKTLNIPGLIQAEDYDKGGQGIAYNDTGGSNNGGKYRNDGVDIQNTSDSGGGHNVGWTANGEWLEYTIASTSSGTYSISFRVSSSSSSSSSKSISVSLGGSNLGSIDIPNTGGWQNWQTVRLNNISIHGGSNKVLRLNINGGSFNINHVTFASSSNNNTNYTIRARGITGQEQMRLSVNGNNIKTFTVSTSWQNYTASTSVQGTPRITFINDNGSRDLELDNLKINTTTFQAENQTVNTGVWQNNSCGGSNSQFIHCNGYIEFTNSSRLTSSGNEISESSNSLEKLVSIYPNPSKSTITINLNDKSSEIIEVTFYNSIGRLIKRIQLKENQQDVDISNFSSGIYFAKVVLDGKVATRKLIKQ